jgi:hypothetical protein
VFAGGHQVVRCSGQRGRRPEQPPAGIGQHLHVPAVMSFLPGVVGPVGGDPVDRQHGAVQNHVRLRAGRRHRFVECRCKRGQNVDRLADVAVHDGERDAEPGRELRVGVTAPQVHQGEQDLTARGQPPPPVPISCLREASCPARYRCCRTAQLPDLSDRLKEVQGTGVHRAVPADRWVRPIPRATSATVRGCALAVQGRRAVAGAAAGVRYLVETQGKAGSAV